jgi:hypothetical protein
MSSCKATGKELLEETKVETLMIPSTPTPTEESTNNDTAPNNGFISSYVAGLIKETGLSAGFLKSLDQTIYPLLQDIA